MNILITGATGFVGSNLTKKLINEKHNLFCTLLAHEENPFGEKNIKSIVALNNNIEDICNFLKENNIQGIIHLASIVQSGQHSSPDVEKLVDSNIKFGVIILEAAVKAQIKWFINTGSYWQNYNDVDFSPVNLYAATKEAFMDIARFYYETNDLKFVTLKLFDTYGVNDNRPKIFNLWKKISKSGEILEMSPGNQIIDISYIDDIVDAFVLLANHLQNEEILIESGTVYAVKADKRYTLKELAAIFEKVSGEKLNINWGGRKYQSREVMIPWTGGQNVPDWVPNVSIEDGIKRLLQ